MFNTHELWKFGLLDCHYCQHSNDKGLCCKKSRTCNFCPPDWNAFMSVLVTNLKTFVPISTKETKLVRRNKYKPTGGTFGDVFTLDWFYVQLINDSLSELRKGHVAYVFSLHHIIDILRFERNIVVTYLPDANTFCIYKIDS